MKRKILCCISLLSVIIAMCTIFCISASADTDGTVTETSTLSTEYGTITEQYSDASAYPFAVFDESKKFIGAYANLAAAVAPAKNLVIIPSEKPEPLIIMQIIAR